MDLFILDVLTLCITGYIKSFFVGVVVSLPIGPATVICLRNNMQLGRKHGFYAGLGIAIGDTVYGTLALFGLQSIAEFLTHLSYKLHYITGVILIMFGFFTMFKPSKTEIIPANNSTSSSIIGATLLVTLLNPLVLLIFATVMPVFHLTNLQYDIEILCCSLGVFSGALFWWYIIGIILTKTVKVNPFVFLQILDKIFGLLLVIFGLITLVK